MRRKVINAFRNAKPRRKGAPALVADPGCLVFVYHPSIHLKEHEIGVSTERSRVAVR